MLLSRKPTAGQCSGNAGKFSFSLLYPSLTFSRLPPWGRFHRLPFGPSLRNEDARTVPIDPLTFKLRCSVSYTGMNIDPCSDKSPTGGLRVLQLGQGLPPDRSFSNKGLISQINFSKSANSFLAISYILSEDTSWYPWTIRLRKPIMAE